MNASKLHPKISDKGIYFTTVLYIPISVHILWRNLFRITDGDTELRGSLLHNFILIMLDVKSTKQIHHGECNVDLVKYENMKFSKPV